MSENALGGRHGPLAAVVLASVLSVVGCGGGSSGSQSLPVIPSAELPVPVGRVLPTPSLIKTAGVLTGQTLPELPIAKDLPALAVFTQLAHQVRFFHPSDGVADTNWDEFLQYGMYKLLARPADQSLELALGGLFAQMAPGLRLNPTGPVGTLPEGQALVAWIHRGYNDPSESALSQSVYRSQRQVLDRAQLDKQTEGPARSHARYQVAGMTVELPLVQVWRDATLPASSGFRVPSGVALSDHLSDPYLCLAIAAKTWGTLKHFFPYFPALPALDWDAELTPLLRSCDKPASERPESLIAQLKLSLTKLQDNHIVLDYPAPRLSDRSWLSVAFDVVEGKAVVINRLAPLTDIPIGDELLAINGEPVSTLLARLAPSEMLNAHLAPTYSLIRASYLPNGVEAELSMRAADGSRYQRRLFPSQSFDVFSEGFSRQVFEGAPLTRWLDKDILYVNLSDVATPEQLDLMDAEMSKARGWVLDLRRYPKLFQLNRLLARFSPTGMAKSLPMRYIQPVDPEQPARRIDSVQDVSADRLLTGPVLVMSARTSQSFNEHMLGFAQSAGIKVIGERTSGANGNITYIRMSQMADFSIRFTGMEVRQHDGSVFHARGIQPDINFAPSIKGLRSGEDELLNEAYRRLRAQLQP